MGAAVLGSWITFTDPDNQRSRAVMHRLEMRYVKRIRHDREVVLYTCSAADTASARGGHGTGEASDRWQEGLQDR